MKHDRLVLEKLLLGVSAAQPWLMLQKMHWARLWMLGSLLSMTPSVIAEALLLESEQGRTHLGYPSTDSLLLMQSSQNHNFIVL